MKTLFILLFILTFGRFAAAQERQTRPATAAEVSAGTVANKFVSPKTLTGFASGNGLLPTSFPSVIQTNLPKTQIYEAFPVLDKSPDGKTIYCVYRSATAHAWTNNCALLMVTSTNGGGSWSAPSVVITNAAVDWRNQDFCVVPTGSKAGRLILISWALTETGWSNVPGMVMVSDDGGSNWTVNATGIPTNVVYYPFGTAANGGFGRIIYNKGRLHAPVYNQATALSSLCYDAVSDDDGDTWTLKQITPTGEASNTEVEPEFLAIPGTDTIYCFSRPNVRRSDDNGETWINVGNFVAPVDSFSATPHALSLIKGDRGLRVLDVVGNRSGGYGGELGRLMIYDFPLSKLESGNMSDLLYGGKAIAGLCPTNALDGGYASLLTDGSGNGLAAYYYAANFKISSEIRFAKIEPAHVTTQTFNSSTNISSPLFSAGRDGQYYGGSQTSGAYTIGGSGYQFGISSGVNLGMRFEGFQSGSRYEVRVVFPGDGTTGTNRGFRVISRGTASGTVNRDATVLFAADDGNTYGKFAGDATSLTNLNLNLTVLTNGIQTGAFSNLVSARIPVFVIAGVTNYITLSTNAP